MSINKNQTQCVLSRVALVATTLIWGTSFVILKNALNEIPVLYILAYRFTGAALLLLLFGLKDLKKLDWQYVKGGAIMGVLVFVAYTLQTYGLEHTTPGKNAFLTTTYCILVPFIYWISAKKKPSVYNFIAAVICVAGVGFVSLDSNLSINIGDVLSLCCGLFYALHIVATSKYVEGRSVVLLTMIQFTVAGALCWATAGLTAPMPTEISGTTIWSIVYLTVMCTAVCYVLQSYGQKHTPPSSVAVIMTFESVFGALISVIYGYEDLKARLVIGFCLIFIAVFTSETELSFLRKKKTVLSK